MKLFFEPEKINFKTIYDALYTDDHNKLNCSKKRQFAWASAVYKGLYRILKIFKKYNKQYKNMELIIMYPSYVIGCQKKYIEELCTDIINELYDKIKILGPQTKDAYNKYIEESIIVFSWTFEETFGCVFAESLYLGTPIICDIKSSAVAELIADENKYIANYDNIE